MRTIKPNNISPLEQAVADDSRLTDADRIPEKTYSIWQKIAAAITFGAFYIATLAGAGIAVSSCGNGGEDNEDPVTVSGSATDGPYIALTPVKIVELNNRFISQPGSIDTWTDALGRFTVELRNNTTYMGSVDGKNFDEVAGVTPAGAIELKGFFRTGTAPAAEYNINDFTHLITERVKTLYATGLSFEDASIQARDELLSELNMIVATPGCQPYEMDIISGPNDCDNTLLAVEILVRQYAHTRALTSGNDVETEIQTLLNNTAAAFGTGGIIPDATKTGLRQAAMDADVPGAVANLTTYFSDNGLTAIPPDADAVIDSDLDGEVNATDCMPRDGSRWSGHADVDGDGHQLVVCGGDDCDDDCATCYPGATEACGEARDHDCDGLVDELSGCGACTAGTPVIIGSLSIGAIERNNTSVQVIGNTAFVSDLRDFHIIDVSDKLNPLEVSVMPTGPEPSGTMMRGLEYVSSVLGFYVIDVSSPSSPSILGGPIDVQSTIINNMAADPSRNLIYIASHIGLLAVDVSNSSDPKFIGKITEEAPNSVFVNGTTAYITAPSGLYLLQYNFGRSPDFGMISSLEGFPSQDVFVMGNNAFATTGNDLLIVDVGSPSSPSEVGRITLDDHLRRLFVAAQQAFIISDSKLYVVNVSMPSSPLLESTLQNVDRTSVEDGNYAITISGEYGYIISRDGEGSKLNILNLDCI